VGSVAIGANIVVAGSPQDGEAGTNVGAVYIFGGLTTAVAEDKTITPAEFALAQNYPNPFWSGATSPASGGGNPSTAIRFQLPVNSHVTLRVFDVNGREVAMLVDGNLAAGNHSVTFAPHDLAGGICFYQITAGKFSQTRKAVLMK
jgi:hypothetical protein